MATHNSLFSEQDVRRTGQGIAVSVQLPWYRSLWLSSVSGITVAVEGRPIPTESLRVELAGRTYSVADLPEQWDTLWFIQDRLVVVVPLEATGLDRLPAEGEPLDIEASVELRLPYMQIAPMTYVSNHATTRRSLAAR